MVKNVETVPKIERLMNLVCYLYKKGQPVTIQEIKDKVRGYSHSPSDDALRQMLHRDRAELENMGIYVTYVADEGYCVDEKSKYLPKIKFNPDEKLALIAMIRAHEKGKGFLFEEDLRSAAVKISLQTDILKELEEEDPRYGVFFLVEPEEENKLELLYVAMEKKKKIVFSYRPPSASKSSRRIACPLGLFFRDGSWYLAANIEEIGVRVFRLDRMKDIEMMNPEEREDEYDIPPDFEISVFADKKPWMYEEASPLVAKLKFNPKLSVLAQREFTDAEIIEETTKGLILRVKVTSPKRFLRKVLEFGADVEIIEPFELRHMLIKKMQTLKEALDRD